MTNPDQLFPENPEEATEAWFNREKDRFEARFAGVLMWSNDGMNWHVFTEESQNDLLPENPEDLTPWHPLMGFGWDAVRRVESYHFCGIADVLSRDSINQEKEV